MPLVHFVKDSDKLYVNVIFSYSIHTASGAIVENANYYPGIVMRRMLFLSRFSFRLTKI